MQLNCHLDLVSCSVIGIYIIDSSSPREAMQGTIQQFIYLLSISLRKGPTKGSIACARWSPTKNIHTYLHTYRIQNTKQNRLQSQKSGKCLSVHLKLPAFCFRQQKSENGNEFQIIGTATKNECLNALIVLCMFSVMTITS